MTIRINVMALVLCGVAGVIAFSRSSSGYWIVLATISPAVALYSIERAWEWLVG